MAAAFLPVRSFLTIHLPKGSYPKKISSRFSSLYPADYQKSNVSNAGMHIDTPEMHKDLYIQKYYPSVYPNLYPKFDGSCGIPLHISPKLLYFFCPSSISSAKIPLRGKSHDGSARAIDMDCMNHYFDWRKRHKNKTDLTNKTGGTQ